MADRRCVAWLVIALGLRLFVGATPCWAADWPAWRGPTGLGFTDEKGLPLTWGGKDGSNIRWKAALPGSDGRDRPDENQSSPVVRGDRVFVTTSYWPAGSGPREKEYPQHHVTCFRAGDGRRLWDTVVQPGPWLLKDLRGGYTAPTPATDGERVYVLFGSAVLAALDYQGQIVWRKEIIPFTFDVAIGSSPVVYKDLVILLCGMANRKDSRLVAFDARTGDIRWECKRPTMGFAHSTPVIIEVGGSPELVVNASGAGMAPDGVLGLDPASGKVIWWCKGAGDAATPAYGSGVLYCDSGRGGPGEAIDPSGTGDLSKTGIRWTVGQVPEGLSSAVIVGGRVYRVHEPGVLKCWDAAKGTLIYAQRLNGVSTWASPVADADGRIYFASAGKSYVIRAGPRAEILATNDLGDESRASPAVSGGRIYLKGRRFLYCVGEE